MVVNEELIAAYIDGNVTAEERKAVREFLAKNPVEQDLVMTLMEGLSAIDEDLVEEKTDDLSISRQQSFSDISYAAAAFAPKVAMQAPQGKAQNKIRQRLRRMSSFLDELEQED